MAPTQRHTAVLCDQRCRQQAAWTREVALEVSVDTDAVPVVISLAGTLDGDTGLSLNPVVAELIGEGARSFVLVTCSLCVPDESGVDVLDSLERLVHSSGASLDWDGSTVNRSFVVGLHRSKDRQQPEHPAPVAVALG